MEDNKVVKLKPSRDDMEGVLKHEEKLKDGFRRAKEYFIPRTYFLKIIKPRDLLLVGIATTVSTTAALYPEINIMRVFWRTLFLLLLVFVVLITIDAIIVIILFNLKK